MKRTRAPRQRAAPSTCSHPARDPRAARAYLAARFTPEELDLLDGIAAWSWDGDVHAKPPPDSRERERIRAQIASLRSVLVQRFAGTTREIFNWDRATDIRKALAELEEFVSAPETPKETRLRKLQEDRAKGGMSWWASLVLARAAGTLARRPTPMELHALAVAHDLVRPTTKEETLAKRDAEWRQIHARSVQYACDLVDPSTALALRPSAGSA